ncbi:MAG: hypothetical protein ACOYJY_06355 [Acutalibacteraceae bacterium]
MKNVSHLFSQSGKIESFESVMLSISAMRYMIEYEIVMKGTGAEISMYGIGFPGGERTRRLQKRTVCDTQTALKLLNDCALLSWNGFNGPHPKGVKDGTMFTLKATVNGGKKIYAAGSQNFPKHYRDFTDGLHALLDGADVIMASATD